MFQQRLKALLSFQADGEMPNVCDLCSRPHSLEAQKLRQLNFCGPLAPPSSTAAALAAGSGGWLDRPVGGVLLDVHGVLYDSGAAHHGKKPISGSVEAVKRLHTAGIPIRVVSNASTNPPWKLLERLHDFGFDSFRLEDIHTPVPAAKRFIRSNELRPHLLVHPNVQNEFADLNQNEPNCVLLGDAQTLFTHENLNRAFQLLIEMPQPLLVSMGCGRYYKAIDGMKMDVGAYTAMLRHALNDKLHVVTIGKPDATFFMSSIDEMNLTIEDVVMIGDDIVSDIGGAQQHGIRAVQVRTGKWMPEWESHESVRPDAIVDDLAQAVDLILAARQ